MKRKTVFVIALLMLGIPACRSLLPARPTPSPAPSVVFWTPEPYNPYDADIPPTVTPTLAVGGAPSPTWTPPPPAPPTATATATIPSLPPTATPTALPPTPTPGPGNQGGAAWTPVVPIRPGPVVYAARVPAPPAVDGDLGEWQAFSAYGIVYPTYGRHAYAGPNDVSGTLYVGWDDTYLYLAFQVVDDVLVQEASGRYLYRGDSTEILVDTDLFGDRYVRALNYDDFQLGFSPGRPFGQGPLAWLWYPRAYERPATEVPVAVQTWEQGYRMEVAVPWGLFRLTPYPGLRVGFAASISDNDRPGTAIQQTLVSHSPYRHLTDPTTWGELVLYPCAPQSWGNCPQP